MKRRLADYLCRFACYLRGEKWYVADTWHGVPGNRAAELRQKIWLEVVYLKSVACDGADADTCDSVDETLDTIDHSLAELSQVAGESCGHVWPKEAAK